MILALKDHLLRFAGDAVFRRQIVRFFMLGAARTVLGYLLYLLLLQIMPYWAAFTVCYIVTILVSAFVNSSYVFRTQLTGLKILLYGAIYCINYVLSLGVLSLAITVLGLDAHIAPALVIAVMFPVGFLTERYALMR